MRRSIWTRVLAVVLIITMLAAPVSAATASSASRNGWGSVIGIIVGVIRDIFDDWFDNDDPVDPTDPTESPEPEETTAPTEPEETTTPTEPEATEPEETEPTEPEAPETVLNLVEGHANTENGYLLRGVTYTLSTLAAQEEQEAIAPYALRSTMASTYSQNAVSTAAETTADASTETTVSDTALVITTDDLGVVIPDGEYVIQCLVDYARDSLDGSYLTNQKQSNSPWGTNVLLGDTNVNNATHFTFTRQADGSYAIQGPSGNYLNVGQNAANIDADTSYFTAELNDGALWLKDTDGYYFNALGADASYYTSAYFGGWDQAGSPVALYAIITTSVDPEEPEQPESDAELIYFPVTMFNYDGGTINAITDSLDTNGTTVREGFYFSDGGSELGSVTFDTTVDTSAFVAGRYYIQNIRASENDVGSWLFSVAEDTSIRGTTDQSAATLWTLVIEDGEFYLMSGGKYLYVGTNGDTDGLTDTKTPVTLTSFSGNSNGVQIGYNGYYLCQWGSSNSIYYGGYNSNNDPGNGMYFYAVDSEGNVSDTPTTITANSVMTSGYERWNWWGYKSNGHTAQNMFYSGLVEDKLNANNEIVFTVNEPGIFTFDAEAPTVTNDGKKDIYQNVGLPFVKNDKGYYTFDSDAHGTYFADTTGDGNSDPWYGAEDDFFNMYFDYQNTQGWAEEGGNLGYGDGSSNLWAPYNTNANDTGAANIDYHFGMRADIPFSMTSNGRIKSTDDNSDPITFTFKGDDDVWIFIDGHLVIDLGGIHNRIGATIDFANNTITYFKPESNNQALDIGCYNDPEKYPLNEDGTITVKLYDDAQGEGALGQTRFDFSSEEEHQMSIFYLERGKGTSNCQIEFNLPMRDTLLVTKQATHSWSEEQDKVDGENGDGTINLTAREQAAVNNMNFGFTLYKKAADETAFTAVASTNFFIQDQDGNIVGHSSTDANGKFYLKNGQTAKFMTDFPKEGVTYYVVEDTVPQGFLTPDYMYDGVATMGYDYIDADGNTQHITLASEMGEHELALDAAENKSYVVTAYGSVESIDSLEFICVNYLDQRLPNPTAIGNEDIIVIDYGLPVQIDPLANDLFRGDSIEIVAWGDESLTLNEVLDSYGNAVTHDDENAETKTTWSTPTTNFHSGTVAFNDVTYTETQSADDSIAYTRDTFTYTLNKQLTEVEVISYIIRVDSKVETNVTGSTATATRYALAKVYIVPATIMYYEENFGKMVKFSNAAGTFTPEVKQEAEYISPYQEPGVVGTIDDSTYGSDVAYRGDEKHPGDAHDSNGTSYFFDTTDGYVRFQYTFTGTGTSFFARTSAKTGYMQILLFAGADVDPVANRGSQITTYYRDTYWNSEGYPDDTLYNIPVFTESYLDYGTYTLVVTVAKMGTPTAENTDGSGNEFYLDGIRIMQPLNEVIVEHEEYDEDGNVIKPAVYDEMTTKALGAYATDGESNLDVVTLRMKLIADVFDGESVWDEENFVVLTDTNGEIITAEEYESIGPKEEVYLAPQQKVRFSLKYWQPEGLKLYMGMKAPFGSAKLNVGNSPFELEHAADCYYDVTNSYASLVTAYEQKEIEDKGLIYTDANGNEVYEDADGNFFYSSDNSAVPEDTELTPVYDQNQPYFVVTYTFEATDSIVSLTNIKVVGNYEFIILENTDITLDGSNGEGEDIEGDFEADIEMP